LRPRLERLHGLLMAPQPQSAGRGDDVQGNADPGRRAQADGWDQPEARAYRAKRGTCSIRSVKHAR
jgi:hypothetical protein